MRKYKRKSSGSKWMAVVAVALLAAVAWNAYRTPGTTPAIANQSVSTDGTRTTTALELPPPVTEDATTTTTATGDPAARYPGFLPAEASDTLRLIERGGPYPYRQDDGTFGNREGRLPKRARGYYREYTVETPGSPDRGARRIIAGGQPPTEYFYTADHYGSFRRFTLDGAKSGSNAGDDGKTSR